MTSDWLDIKEDLCNYLQVIDSGNFAASGPVTNARNPGLFVQGIGKIGLPLSDRDAADLCRVGHEAPFGKGSETFVDPTVRETWELNPNQFELRNPAWPLTLQEVVTKVAEELGVIDGASGIRAELHKLLLYERGAFFNKHRDTEKAPGMFATLVIALPSEHTGGDVVVQLRAEEQILRTQGQCDFGYSYLAWYADVNHSVSKVESGHRLVLTYNLIRRASDSSQMASVLDDHKQNLDNVLALWSEQGRETNDRCDPYEKLVYILEHEYSEANIRLDQLKGKDQFRARYLVEACQSQGFCLFFAHLEYSQSGSVDEYEDDARWGDGSDYHEFIDEIDSKWRLQTVFQPDGKQIADDIALEEEDLLETADFTGIEPDDEECDGWTGNEGCTATHFYHRTCVVILPRARRFDFLSRAETFDVQEYTDMLLREISDDTSSVALREELEKICELAVVEKKKLRDSVRVPDEELASIGKAILCLDRPDLLEKLARVTSRPVPIGLFQELGKGLIGHEISLWHDGIKLAVSRLLTISERVKAVDLLVSSYREAAGNAPAAMQRMQDFERDLAMSLTETQSGQLAVTAADTETLMQLSGRYGEKYTFQVVLPLVKKHTSNVNFTVAFLTALFQAGEVDKLRLEVVRNIFKDVLGDMTLDIHLLYEDLGRERALNEFVKRRRFDYINYGSQATEYHSPGVMTTENLATVFFQCEKLGLAHEIKQLDDKIVSQTPHANVLTFDRLLLPLLKQLPPLDGEWGTTSHKYETLFRTILSSYVKTYVQSPPQKPTGLERQPRGCSLYCEDCVQLDAFLKDPHKASTHFAVKAKRRDHLEERLRDSHCSTETLRSGSPYTLVVKKKGSEWENAMKEWKQRCGVALKAVEGVGFEKLKGLLGERWEEVVGMRDIKAGGGEGSGQRRPLEDLEQGKATSGGGVAAENGVSGKAPVRVGPEIIDLSCE